MKAIVGIIVVILLYIGATSIGLNIFDEDGFAAWTGVIIGGFGLNWLIKNTNNNKYFICLVTLEFLQQ
jgi:hypothetical protein